MTGSPGDSVLTGRLLWTGAFILATGAFAGSVAAIVPGFGWGAVAAAAAAAGLLVLLGVARRAWRDAVDAAGFVHGEYVKLAGECGQRQAVARRQAAEALQREDAHHSVLASRARHCSRQPVT